MYMHEIYSSIRVNETIFFFRIQYSRINTFYVTNVVTVELLSTGRLLVVLVFHRICPLYKSLCNDLGQKMFISM